MTLREKLIVASLILSACALAVAGAALFAIVTHIQQYPY